MRARHRVGQVLYRSRYVVLSAWAILWFLLAYESRPGGLSDWLLFEFGARTLIHYNRHYSSGTLSLYAHYPLIQVGPPPLVLLAGFQWLPPRVTEIGFGLAMSLAGVWSVRCAETSVRRVVGASREHLDTTVMLAAAVALPMWAWSVGRQQHLDDVLAITATLAAMAVIGSGRRWWLAGILVGLAVASKPWAVVITPCLLAVPREQRSRAVLAALASAALWWAPFVVGDQHTISALGGFQFPVKAGSTLHTLGLGIGLAPRWVRPVQFVGGAVFAALVVRRDRWLAVPLAGFAFRVVTDPQTWLYYGMGSLLGALLWDCAGSRRFPRWTVATGLVEFVVPLWLPTWAGPVRGVWFPRGGGCVATACSIAGGSRADRRSATWSTARVGVALAVS